jgi:hypothetical protein
MSYVKDVDRTPAGPTAMHVAAKRSERLDDPIDRHRFMVWFERARVATARGDDRLELWFEQAWISNNSVMMAGLIEGATSVPSNERKRLTYR